MAKVYKDTTCNLLVSGFSSCVDGFLPGRRPSNPVSPQCSLHLKGGRLYYVVEQNFKRSIHLGALLREPGLYRDRFLYVDLHMIPPFNRDQVPSAVHFGWD